MAGWSDRDRDRLAILAEAFAAGDARQRAGLAIEALDRALEPGQVRQLRLALRLMDLRVANRLYAGRAAPLSRLSPEERERLLLGWGLSRLPLQRSAFQAWKRLLLFLAYAIPVDADGRPNRHWSEMGYKPDRPPLADATTPIVPFHPETAELDADVAIVGSGAGGGVIAAELARAGRSVVVLEAGPFVPEPEMPADELTAFDRLYLDHGLCSTVDGSVAILAGATVGGGTTVNWTTSIAVPEEVRAEWAREHGLDGVDGAETEGDLAVLARELGLQPPAIMPAKDGAILRGAAALGLEAAPTARDALACGDCGSCGFGCRRGAKQSGLRVHLADAYRHGARIVPEARVTRVRIEGSAATGVDAIVGEGGPEPRPLTVHARQVVVAAGALRTPAVLIRSGIAHPAAGRYLRLHPVSAIAARYDEPVETWCGPLQAARSVEFLRSGARGRGFIIESAPTHPGLMALAFPWESADDHAAMLRDGRFTAPMIAIARDRGSGTVRPGSGGRARIDYHVAPGDAATLRRGLVETARLARAAGARSIVALGTPSVRLDLGAADGPAALAGRASGSGASGAVAAGTTGRDAAFEAFLGQLAAFDFAPNRGMVFSAHQMGSARMGGPAADHACDPAGRVRADRSGRIVRGLYVGDSSLFPTSIGVNPMITVMLLARRVARTVLAEGTPGW